MDGAPGSFDPAQAASIYANFVVVNVYDTLYRYKYLARPYQLQQGLQARCTQVGHIALNTALLHMANGHRLFCQTMALCQQEQIRPIQIRLNNFFLVGKTMVSGLTVRARSAR